jgi:N-acetyl-gamma-glutamyl-phosphate reductase
MSTDTLRVAVLGASGYTGLEVLRLVLRHPRLTLAIATSEQRAGVPVGDAFPALRALTDVRFEALDAASVPGRADVAFSCLHAGVAALAVTTLRKAGLPVVDLSADFRFSDLATYESAYGKHKAPELVGQAVFGLPELHRAEIARAGLVAAAGCHVTSALLAMVPFLRADLVEHEPAVVVDTKTGVSGAGRTLDEGYLFSELDGNLRAYKVASHRHAPEMEQEASLAAGRPVAITFVPHLLPVVRGLAASVYLRPKRKLSAEDARAVLADAYRADPFVRVLPVGEVPSLQSVRGSNFCDVAAFVDERNGTLIALATLDNLVKGASGQMVQCLNLMQGWPETLGLLEAPLVP